MVNAYRDENNVPTLIAVSNVDGFTPVRLWADPVTHRLLTSNTGGGGSGITIGTTTIANGTDTRILYDNAGVVGEYALTGTGTVVAMQTSPALITPDIGVATGTSLTLTSTTQQLLLAYDGTHNFGVTISSTGVATLAGTVTGGMSFGAGSIIFNISGARFTISSTVLGGNNTNSGGITNNTGSTTVPTILPDRAATTSGFGRHGSNAISVISNGVEVGFWDASGYDGVIGATTTNAGSFTTLSASGHVTFEGVTSTGATGTGNLVFATSPTLTTAVLGSSTATTQAPADNSTKLATTAYVDAAVLGQNFKEATKYATTAALATVVYNNGTSGVGATLTAVGLGAISIDGSTPSVGDRILVKNQVSTFQNGIYTVTIVGTAGTVFVLTRATDSNTTGEFKTGNSNFNTSGTVNSNTTWAYTGVDSPTIGTDAITYAQTAGQGTVTSGNGITVTGLSVAIDTSVTVDKTTAQTLTNKTLTSPILTTPALGTPASGVMTNVTGVPAAAVLAGSFGSGAFVMSSSLQVATIELGAATDTTISRISAGVIAVEGVNILSSNATGVQTFLTTPSSANFAAVITDETGSGKVVFDTAPVFSSTISVTKSIATGFTTTATAAGTTTMDITSTEIQYWTGSSTQTIKLPTTSVLAGARYTIVNQSTGSVTVQSSGANTIVVLGAGMSAIFTAVVATPTTAANWDYLLNEYVGLNNAITASSNAATINLAYKTNTVTNNSAATLTITLPTTGAIDGEMRVVRVLDASAVAQTLTLVNTENSTVTPAATTNGSTTLPYTFGVQYNAGTSKWRIIASA